MKKVNSIIASIAVTVVIMHCDFYNQPLTLEVNVPDSVQSPAALEKYNDKLCESIGDWEDHHNPKIWENIKDEN